MNARRRPRNGIPEPALGAWQPSAMMCPVRAEGGALTLSATDLSNFLNCRHRTALELGEARGKRQRPVWADPLLEALFARGLEHERNYLSLLDAAGKRIANLSDIKAR